MAKTSVRACGLGNFFAVVFGACFGSCLAPIDPTDEDEVVAPRQPAARCPFSAPVAVNIDEERLVPVTASEASKVSSGSSSSSPTISKEGRHSPSLASPRTTPRKSAPSSPSAIVMEATSSSHPKATGFSNVSSAPSPALAINEQSAARPSLTSSPVIATPHKSSPKFPPGLSKEKHSSSDVNAVFAEYEMAIDAVFNAMDTTPAVDAHCHSGSSKVSVEELDHYKSLLPLASKKYQEAVVAKDLGRCGLAKRLLEDCVVYFSMVFNYACDHAEFYSPEEQSNVQSFISTISDELAALSNTCAKVFGGEEFMVSDVAFLKLVVAGSHPVDDDKTSSNIAHICNKLEIAVTDVEADVLNGDKRLLGHLEFSVAAGKMAVSFVEEMKLNYGSAVGEDIVKAAESLGVISKYAEIRLESITKDSNKEMKAKVNLRIPKMKRMDSDISGPTSGDSTPLSDAAAVVSLNDAATDVVVEKKKKRTRRGRGKGRRSGLQS